MTIHLTPDEARTLSRYHTERASRADNPVERQDRIERAREFDRLAAAIETPTPMPDDIRYHHAYTHDKDGNLIPYRPKKTP